MKLWLEEWDQVLSFDNFFIQSSDRPILPSRH